MRGYSIYLHIRNKSFKVGDLVLLYNNKFAKFPGKFSMHWLGPYEVEHVTNDGAVQIAKVNGSVSHHGEWEQVETVQGQPHPPTDEQMSANVAQVPSVVERGITREHSLHQEVRKP